MGESWPGGRKMIQQLKMTFVRTPACLTLMFLWGGILGATTASAEELKYVDANGISFAYLEEGEGPLVLLFHGYPETARSWAFVQSRIAGEGYRVVAPFTRGYPPTTASETGDTLSLMTLKATRTQPR